MRYSTIKAVARAGIIASLSGMAWMAAAHTPATQPAEAWEVNVAPAECTLTRTIASPTPITLSLHTIPGSDSYRLAFVGKELPPQRSRDAMPVTLVFAPGQSFDRKAQAATLANGLGQAIVIKGLEPEVVAAFAQASSISLTGKSPIGPFALPNAKGAARALAGCVRDQLVEWGADPAQFEANGKLPVALTPREDWVPTPELLKMPIPDSRQIDAVFRVSVAADGSIDACAPVGTVAKKVQEIACAAVVNRRLFTPASDAQGKPVRGAAVFEVHLIARPTNGRG